MSTDEQDNGGRLTNSEILRELRAQMQQTVTSVAVLSTQMGTALAMLASSDQKHDDVLKRVQGHDTEFVDARARIVVLEGRPAMTPDERAALKAQVVEHERRIATNETHIHDAQLRDFSADQKDELRRYLIDRQRRGKWWDELTLGAVLQIMSPVGVIIALAVAHFAGWH